MLDSTSTKRFRCAIPGAAALVITGGALAADKAPTAAEIEFFEKKVRPVLVERCYQCHAEKSEKIKGDLHVGDRTEPCRQPPEAVAGTFKAARSR